MKKNIFALILLALTINLGFTSCEDMLTGDMDRNIGIDEMATDTLYSYWGILKSVQDVAERYVILGECRGDMVAGADMFVSDSIRAILNFGKNGNTSDGSNRFLKAADFYKIINSCNAYIQQCDTAALSGLNRPLMKSEYSQVVTIRAWAYMQLVLTYGRVPYFEKPLLSTADMEEFRNAPQTVDATSLAVSGVAQKVAEVRHIPPLLADDPRDIIAYPNYGYYGSATDSKKVIAHSSQCVFPQDVVLGDLYLLRAQGAGSEADYRQAAQYYYNFLNSEKGGPLRQAYYGIMRKMRDTEQYHLSVDSWSYMFGSISQTNQTNEIVTVIPSNKNKLYGTVFRAMNELFGFDQTLSVSTDSVGTGRIDLEGNFQHQLDASKTYKDLNMAQDYEVYVGDEERCMVFEGCGDARYRMSTKDLTDYDTGSSDAINFVTKQNPLSFGDRAENAQFITTYPVIYRKASIWLHFAQALNGAGFPGYAFAILRHGIVGTDGWLPKDETSYNYIGFTYYDPTDAGSVDPNPSYAKYEFYDPTTETEEVKPTVYSDYDAFFNDMLHPGLELLTTHDDSIAYKNVHMTVVPKTRSLQSSVVCNYISQREMEAAKSASFLNFKTSYLQGTSKGFSYYVGVTEHGSWSGKSDSDAEKLEAASMGVHARGCGFLKLKEANASYTFVKQVNKMRKLYEGATTDMTEEQIFNAANLREVQKAIADLILDELGLETAFEGNRFFDLLCYSRFIGGQTGVERVARKIASRKGSLDQELYSHLCSEQNWYFKLDK